MKSTRERLVGRNIQDGRERKRGRKGLKVREREGRRGRNRVKGTATRAEGEIKRRVERIQSEFTFFQFNINATRIHGYVI